MPVIKILIEMTMAARMTAAVASTRRDFSMIDMLFQRGEKAKKRRLQPSHS